MYPGATSPAEHVLKTRGPHGQMPDVSAAQGHAGTASCPAQKLQGKATSKQLCHSKNLASSGADAAAGGADSAVPEDQVFALFKPSVFLPLFSILCKGSVTSGPGSASHARLTAGHVLSGLKDKDHRACYAILHCTRPLACYAVML